MSRSEQVIGLACKRGGGVADLCGTPAVGHLIPQPETERRERKVNSDAEGVICQGILPVGCG
jgi:hypothetical protein